MASPDPPIPPEDSSGSPKAPGETATTGASLRKQFTGGVSWLYGLRLVQRFVGTAQIVVVARFVAPEEFGVIGVALLMLGLLEMLATTGLDQALIQKSGRLRNEMDTVWWTTAARGFLLGAILFLAAPLVAAFFDEPRSEVVVRFVALVPIARGLQSIGLTALTKDLAFGRLAALELVKTAVVAVSAVVLAVWLRSVWALVIVQLIGPTVQAVGSYAVHPYRPKLRFRFDHLRKLWGFSKWIAGGRWAHYLADQGDNWVVGRVLGAAPLGLYRAAYRLGSTPMTEVTGVLSRVAFPTFSKMLRDPERMGRAYLRLLHLVAFVSTPLSVSLIILAEPGVPLLLGEKWAPMVPALQVLLVGGVVRSFRATTGPVLQAIGRPDIVTKVTVLRVSVLFALIVPLSSRFGIIGAAWSAVAALVIETPWLLLATTRAVHVKARDVFMRIGLPLLYVLPMAVTMVGTLRALEAEASSWVSALLAGILGAAAYLLAARVTDHRIGYGAVADFRSVGRSVLGPIRRRLAVLVTPGLRKKTTRS